jgi:hypothetical protein
MEHGALVGSLFAHQRAALEWMRALEAGRAGVYVDASQISVNSTVGILGEPPGAGKTRTVVALVSATTATPPPHMPARFTAKRTVGSLAQFTYTPIEVERAQCSPSSLVVVSASLVAQWERELSVAAATQRPLIVRLNRDVVALGKALEADEPLAAVILVCVRRYGAVVELMNRFGYKPRRVVIDEAYHLVRDSALMQRVATAFTWLVGAMPETPCGMDLVLPRHRCFWSDLRTLSRAEMRLVTFRTDDAALVYPCEVVTTYHDCLLDSSVSYAARAGVAPEVREMLDANDIAGAIGLLGGAEGEDLMTVVRRRITLDLEATALELSSLQYTQRRHDILAVPVAAQQRTLEALARCEQRRARLMRDAENVESRFVDALRNDCPICHDALESPVLLTCCQHIFCSECALRWLHANPRCPTCSSHSFRVEKIATHDGTSAPSAPRAAVARRPTKVEQCERIIAVASKGVLVYSSHTNGLASLGHKLRAGGVRTSEVKGLSTSRDKALASFAVCETKVLLLDATLNCAGIDLQHVSDIIIYHDMDEKLKHQIIGRGRRINRTAQLNVHYLWRAAERLQQAPREQAPRGAQAPREAQAPPEAQGPQAEQGQQEAQGQHEQHEPQGQHEPQEPQGPQEEQGPQGEHEA